MKHIPLQGARRLLDLGCGSGSMARLMAAASPGAQVSGVDVRPEYLEFARALAVEDGLDNVAYVEGDAFELPFEDSTFDLVWHKYLLQWVHDPKAALAEMKRVTRPGGVVVSCVFDGFMRGHYPVEEDVQEFVDKVMPDICDCYVARKMPVMLQELGFEDIGVEVERDRLFTFVGSIGG